MTVFAEFSGQFDDMDFSAAQDIGGTNLQDAHHDRDSMAWVSSGRVSDAVPILPTTTPAA